MADRSKSPYPPVGKKAPAFSLPASTGKKISLKDYTGTKHVVLYFYPKDDTPGCTTEACGFRDAMADFEKLDAVVLGVSPDAVDRHRKFIDKFALPFALLADENHAICQKYGVWQEKVRFGKKKMGVARTTFVIDKAGKIAKVFPSVKPDGHDQQVLKFIREALQ